MLIEGTMLTSIVNRAPSRFGDLRICVGAAASPRKVRFDEELNQIYYTYSSFAYDRSYANCDESGTLPYMSTAASLGL